jgi:MFS transporter, DHA3 family, macrolide efflux protein
MQAGTSRPGMKTFVAIWFGQTISMLGSGITAFGISVWIFQETGSVTLFALNSFLNFLPRTLLSPLAGLLADRWPRRRIMILADTGAAASTVFLALMLFSGNLALWHVYLVTAVNALFNTFQAPAYAAAATAMTPPERYTRASAMLQLSGQFSSVVAPTIAAFLLPTIGLPGIMILDFSSFLTAVSILILRRFPEPAPRRVTLARNMLLREMFEGWRYIAGQPALRGLLYLFGFNLFFIATNATLSIPILLTVTSVEAIGVLSMLFGIVSLFVSAAITAWGGMKYRIQIVFFTHCCVGLGLILFGLRPNFLLVASAWLLLALVLPVRDIITDTIWRSKVPSELQGRIYALLQLISSTAFGLSYLVVGPLADHVFDPWMAEGGLLSGSVGSIIGVGAGRGLGLCDVLAGILTFGVTFIAIMNVHVRKIESELPDVNAAQAA